jgi:hypothetical protein
MWQPATLEEVIEALALGLAKLHPIHLRQFENIRTTPRRVYISSAPEEFVYIVAEHQGKILYYSDIEEGWELEIPNVYGGIDARGCNQFELTHIMYQAFGNPSEQSA